MLLGFDRTDRDTELLSARPTHSCAINKDGRVLPGKKDTKSDHHARLNRVCPIDTPSVKR